MGATVIKTSYMQRIEAILNPNTITRGLERLKRDKTFLDLKKKYGKLKDSLKKSTSDDDVQLTDEEAMSLINYAIHADTGDEK